MSTRRFEDLVADIQTEINQLQSEWSAVCEYCTEVQQQQRDAQEELSSLELEEKLLTRKLQELLGPSEFPDLFSNNDQDLNRSAHVSKQSEKNQPWRILNEEERLKALRVILQEENDANSENPFHKRSAETQARILSTQLEENHEFVFDHHHYQQDVRVDHAGSIDISNIILQISQDYQDATEVGNVLQRQKEFLMSKMQQCGAVSVALDAMLLYRAPPGGSY